MVRHRPTVVLIVFLTIGFLLLSLRVNSKIQTIKGFLYYILDPGPKGMAWILQHTQDSGGFLVSLISLNEENRDLRNRLNEYIHQQQDIAVLKEENARLQQLVGFTPAPK